MGTKHKQFKPFDKVLIKDGYGYWGCDLYSHWFEKKETHCTVGFGSGLSMSDYDIIPYEGNEHLVGTTDEPEEEVKLEEGELLVYFAGIKFLESMDLFLARFDGIINDLIKVKSNGMQKWEYAIPFSDFNPNDMEETKKHILCVKNGKIIRYKG